MEPDASFNSFNWSSNALASMSSPRPHFFNLMNALGWIIWCLGCLLLINGLARLRKPRGRILRALFCLITAAALALTLLTPLSKFHLLWILPLRLLLGLFGFGALAGAGVAYSKLTARKPERTTLPAGTFPPFGPLTWHKYQWWEGEGRLPAWAGFQSRRGCYSSQDSDSPSDGSVTVRVTPGERGAPLEPTPEQCRAMEFQIQHGEEVVESVLTALLPYYRELKKDWEMDDEHMPPVAQSADLRNMIGLDEIHILPHVSDGLAYVSLDFGCNWDEEHGLGIVLHGKQVIEIGQQGDICDWRPAPSGTGD